MENGEGELGEPLRLAVRDWRKNARERERESSTMFGRILHQFAFTSRFSAVAVGVRKIPVSVPLVPSTRLLPTDINHQRDYLHISPIAVGFGFFELRGIACKRRSITFNRTILIGEHLRRDILHSIWVTWDVKFSQLYSDSILLEIKFMYTLYIYCVEDHCNRS